MVVTRAESAARFPPSDDYSRYATAMRSHSITPVLGNRGRKNEHFTEYTEAYDVDISDGSNSDGENSHGDIDWEVLSPSIFSTRSVESSHGQRQSPCPFFCEGGMTTREREERSHGLLEFFCDNSSPTFAYSDTTDRGMLSILYMIMIIYNRGGDTY